MKIIQGMKSFLEKIILPSLAGCGLLACSAVGLLSIIPELFRSEIDISLNNLPYQLWRIWVSVSMLQRNVRMFKAKEPR